MRSIVITVEVNNFWLTEQQEKGKAPFEQIREALLQKFSELCIVDKGTKMEISNVSSSKNMQVREYIKKFFAQEYEMYIHEGDFKMTARVYNTYDEPKAEPDKQETATVQEATQEPEETAACEETVEADKTQEDKTEESQEEEPQAPKAASQKPVEKDAVSPKSNYIKMPALEEFLQEMETVIQNAKRYNISETIWSTNVLLSVDGGYGVSSITEKIADLLRKQGFAFNSKTRDTFEEYVIPDRADKADAYWKELFQKLEGYYTEEKHNERRFSNEPFIIYIDISVYLGNKNNKNLYDYLYRLSKLKGSYIYVFRIPYVEQVAFQNMERLLTDIFLIRPVVIPPLTCAELVHYLKSKLRRKGMIVQEDVDDLLEQLIASEKKDGYFKGFSSVKRLSEDIIYNKLMHLKEGEEPVISRQDLIDLYEFIQENEPNPEEVLAQLCGMENVKQTIDEIVAQINLYKEMKQSGKKLSAPTMHMRFVGNPGTGKTTVARLVAQIFKEKGILSKGYFYEIKARDLCGRYIGETAPKTSGYCKDALGSVLFIDEAYTLYHDDDDRDYGKEAIDTLITEMENNRDNLVVIMAGYKEEMDNLLKSNDGLASRMPYEIEFRNYTKKELVEIFYSMLGNDFTYTDAFDSAVREFIENIPDEILEQDTFGNARMIRNLYERIWSKAAYRRSISGEKEMVLQEEDVQRAVSDEEFHQLLVNKKSKIGF
ncbi:MAG: AAA family ATPase [Lachnospiraceae bacterium]|nr:AAA family ATPase [Lachnospiraceae bacterium]